MDQGEGIGSRPPASLKRDPLDFALWKAQKEGEDTAWDAPWGRGRPGWHIECSAMAETLLGVGFDIHGGGSDLVFPHHENEAAQTAAARGAPLARLWVHNGMVRLEGEKMAKSVGNIFLLHEALAAHGRDALVAYFCAGHYRQPIAYSEERLGEAARSVERIRDAGRRLVAGRRRRPSWRRCARRSSTRSPTTSTRRERSRPCSSGCARRTAAPRRASRWATPTCARCSACFALDGAARRRRGRRRTGRRGAGAARAARGGARRARLRRGGPPARRAGCARLGGPRQRGRPDARPARLMARPPQRRDPRRPRSAAGPPPATARWSSTAATPCTRRCAGRARCSSVWATRAGGARAVAARARRSQAARGGGDRAPLRLDRPPGALRRGRASTATPTPTTLLAAPDALIVALDEIQDPQNLGAICRTAECAGATGVVIPERRSAEVTPAVCKASAGAVEHLAIARVRNLADFLLDARQSRAPGATAPTATRASRYAQPDYRGKVVLVMGSEGSGLRPRVARSCDELIALPLRGRIELAQRQRRRRGAALRDHPPARRRLDPPGGASPVRVRATDRACPLQRRRDPAAAALADPLDTGSITWQAAAS